MVTLVSKSVARPLIIQVDSDGVPRRLAEASSISVSGLTATTIYVDSISAANYLGAPVGSVQYITQLSDTFGTHTTGLIYDNGASAMHLNDAISDTAAGLITDTGTNGVIIKLPVTTYIQNVIDGTEGSLVTYSGGAARKIDIGSAGQVLRVAGGYATWGQDALSALSDVSSSLNPSNGYVLTWSGSKWIASAVPGSVTTSPGGTTTEVQFRNAGSFAGDTSFTYASSTHVLSVPTIDLYNDSTTEGQVSWDSSLHIPTVVLANSTIGSILLDNLVYGKNTTGSTIQKGQVVYASGSVGSSKAVKLGLANATSLDETQYSIGLCAGDLTNNSFGYFTTQGIISNVSIAAAFVGTSPSDGDVIYLSTTSGKLTITKPQKPNHTFNLGKVVGVNGANVDLFISIRGGFEIEELHNVASAVPSNGQVLVWSSAAGYYTPSTLILAGGATALSGLTDTSVTSTPTNGQFLTWSSTKWVPSGAAGGTGYVQYNIGGILGGSPLMIFDAATGQLQTISFQALSISGGTVSATTYQNLPTSALSGLSDVSSPLNPTNGYVLTWSSSKWIASALPAGAAGTLTSVTGTGTANNLVNQTGPTTAIIRDVSSGSNKLLITSAVSTISFDVVPANININTLGGAPLGVVSGGTGLTTIANGEILVGVSDDVIGKITAGTNLSIGGGTLSVTAAGSTTQVQFNDGGTSLGGNSNLTFNKTTGLLQTSSVSSVNASATSARFGTVSATTYQNLPTSALSGLTDVSSPLNPTNGYVLTWSSSKWIASALPPAGAGTLTSVVSGGSVGGVGIVRQTGPTQAILLDASTGSSKLSLTSATTFFAYDVVESALTLNSIGGTLGVSKGGTGITSIPIGRILISSGIDTVGLYQVSSNLSAAPTSLIFVPSGTGNEIQFNNGGTPNVLGASKQLIWNNTTNTFSATNVSATSVSSTTVSALTGTFNVVSATTYQNIPPSGPALTSLASTGTGIGVLVQSTGPVTGVVKSVSGSSKVAVTNAALEVHLDVTESALTLNNMVGPLNVSKGGTGITSIPIGRILISSGIDTIGLYQVSSNLSAAPNSLIFVPSGTGNEIQFNNGGTPNVLGASKQLIWNNTTNTFSATNVSATSVSSTTVSALTGTFNVVSATTYQNLPISALSGLSDVTATPVPTTGQSLVWNGSKWQASSPPTGGATALSGLTDVSSPLNPTNGYVLTWSSSKWIASAAPGGGTGTPGGTTGMIQYNNGAGGFGGAEGTSYNTGFVNYLAFTNVSAQNFSGLNTYVTNASSTNISSLTGTINILSSTQISSISSISNYTILPGLVGSSFSSVPTISDSSSINLYNKNVGGIPMLVYGTSGAKNKIVAPWTGHKRVIQIRPNTGGTLPINMGTGVTSVGTITHPVMTTLQVNTRTPRTQFLATASSVQVRTADPVYMLTGTSNNYGEAIFVCRWALSGVSTSTFKTFIGLVPTAAAAGTSNALTGTINPSAIGVAASYIGFGCGATETTYRAICNAATIGSAIDLGSNFTTTATNQLYQATITFKFAGTNLNKINFLLENIINDKFVEVEYNSTNNSTLFLDFPNGTQTYELFCGAHTITGTNATATSVNLWHYFMHFESEL